MSSHPHVTIVMLNWNQKLDSLECLDSLARITYPSFSIVVVDNGSSDDSPTAIERWSNENLPITLIRNTDNMGFVSGSNTGIRQALTTDSSYVFLVNNDTVLEPDVVTILVHTAEQAAEIGMVGPKIYQYGKERVLESVGTKTLPCLAQAFLVGHKEEDRGQYDIKADMPYITGTALMVKRSVLQKTGLMDEDYFNYFDDFDWGLRARQAGFRLVINPAAEIQHKGSKAIGFESPFYIHHMVRSRILFARKHISLLPFLFAFLPYLILYRYLRPAVIMLTSFRWGHLRALHRGIWEGFSAPTRQSKSNV